MPFQRLASFPNSRVKNRAPTREADTRPVDLTGVEVDVPFLIVPARADRTRLTLMNKTGQKLFYGYSDSNTDAPVHMGASIESSLAIDTDSLQAVWGKFSVLPVGNIEIDEGVG